MLLNRLSKFVMSNRSEPMWSFTKCF